MAEVVVKQRAHAARVIKEQVRERDGYRCVECGMTQEMHVIKHGRVLDVHRTTPGSYYTLEGCETLCRPCHRLKPRRKRGQIEHVDVTPQNICVRIDSNLLKELKHFAKSRGETIKSVIEQALTRHMDNPPPYYVMPPLPKRHPITGKFVLPK